MNSAADSINSVLSTMMLPINTMLEEFKKVPPMIRSVVDVEGAANGMYSNLAGVLKSSSSLSTLCTSSEVPITLDDFTSSPTTYPRLQQLQQTGKDISEQDCLCSNYKKVEWKFNTETLVSAFNVFD